MSSAQVSYISYYLHAMGLTKERIPIPSSRYLVKRSSLKSCAPDYYNAASALRKSMKVHLILVGVIGGRACSNRRFIVLVYRKGK